MPLHIWESLKKELSGELYLDKMHRAIYATDASVYREMPMAVITPKTTSDISSIIRFANQHKLGIIPRAGGTSLAGQCVGNGIVVDVSKHLNQIIEFNAQEKWMVVQPGIIRDELNAFLKPHGLFFGPETSTANRATIGGMVGNNSSGTNSIMFGVTRNHILEMTCFLADGTLVKTGTNGIENKQNKASVLLNNIHAFAQEINTTETKTLINANFPKPEIHRRNTGYAIDEFLNHNLDYNQLLCGSEGTLAFTTKIKLNLLPLPPKQKVLLCPHFNSVNEALRAVQIVMQNTVYACELMDKTIMDCTKENIEYAQYRFFLKDNPEALLMIELANDNIAQSRNQATAIINQLKQAQLGYAFPTVEGNNITNVWKLRKAGLGLLANIPGDKKAVAVVEDTAVTINDLPNFIEEFTKIMDGYGQNCVYYAHAGAGELHLRPILNLKNENDKQAFKAIATDTAKLVKKYGGSFSGEHGDGRVRASFIPLMVGNEIYQLFKQLKQTWDPNNIFNPGKIVEAKDMLADLRTDNLPNTPPNALMDFSDAGGFLQMAEKCNGSGDCRKLAQVSAGTMCPSYMATRNEKDTTRARANILREFLTTPNKITSKTNNAITANEVKQALDLCLSCKGCKSECPSNVDMAALKAEFYHQQFEKNGIPLRNRLFGENATLNKLAALTPSLHNALVETTLFKNIMGVHPNRPMPKLHKTTLRKWLKTGTKRTNSRKAVYFFIDEFSNFYDVEIGQKAIKLLQKIGYQVKVINHKESGRALISKGLLKRAKKVANANITNFKNLVSEATPLVGIEPSAILTFRDEYLRLANDKKQAQNLAKNTFLLEEFLCRELDNGNLTEERLKSIISKFEIRNSKFEFRLHGHCHQKALSSTLHTKRILALLGNVQEIPSGCCGMAGSFGYENEHYEVSQQIGELVLFPAVRKMDKNEHLCAIGTSCRHQIKDGTGKQAKHWVEFF